jgi:hypothetical protein
MLTHKGKQLGVQNTVQELESTSFKKTLATKNVGEYVAD